MQPAEARALPVEPSLPTDPHHSKISPDDPRLKVSKSTGRTLKKGPVRAVLIVTVGVFLAALFFALAPAAPKATEPASEPQKDVLVAPPELPPVIGEAPVVPPTTRTHGLPVDVEVQEPLAAPAVGQHGAPKGLSPYPRPLSEVDPERQRELEMDREAVKSGLHFGGSDEGEPPRSASPLPSTPSGAAAAVDRAADVEADPNLQARKNDFLGGSAAAKEQYLAHRLASPSSPFEIKAGTVIPVTLLTGINSDLPGQVVGQVRENVFDSVTGNYLLVPQGSRVLASYDSMVAWGQERVLVCWNRLIRPDGSSVSLECMPGVDQAGYAGFKDGVDHHWWKTVTGVVLSSLFAAGAQATAGNVRGLNPTLPQQWAAGAAGELASAGQQITKRNLNQQPTITIRPGFSVNILVSKDMVLRPYER